MENKLVLSPSITNNRSTWFQLIERDEPVVEIVKEKPLPITPVEEPIQTILPKEEIKPVRKTTKESMKQILLLK